MTNYIRIASVLALCTVFWVGCQDSSSSDSARNSGPAAGDRAAASAEPTALSADPVYDAIQSAIADPSIYQRAARLSEILEGAGPEAVPAVRATVDEYRVDVSVAEFGMLFHFWASHDPMAAADWALTPGKARFKGSAVFTAFKEWGRIDPQAATGGVYRTNIEVADIKTLAQLGLVHGWFERDREELLSYIRSQGISVERQRAIFGYVLSLVSHDGAEAAQAWAESLPDDDRRFKLAVFRQTSNALTNLDMPAAIAWCDKHCNTEWGRLNRRSLMRARMRHGDSSPEVLAWLGSIRPESEEDAEERAVSLQICWGIWSRAERAEAIAWFDSLVDSPDAPEWLPDIYTSYASMKAVEDPAYALDFVKNRIEKDKEGSYITVAVRWRDKDPEAVEKWLETAPISDGAKRRIRDYKYKLPEINE